MGLFKTIFSTFSPSFYKKIVAQSFWRSAGYLLLLGLVVSLVFSTGRMFQMKFVIVDKLAAGLSSPQATAVIQSIPEIKIENGTASSPVQQPFIIEKQDFVFVLDTTGKITSLDNYKQGLLLAKNKLIMKSAKAEGSGAEINEFDLARVAKQLIIKAGDIKKNEIAELTWSGKAFSVTENSIKKLGAIILLIILPFSIIIGFVLFVIAKLFHAAFFSLAGLIANRAMDAKLKYENLINICIYALTPPTLLSIAINLLFWQVRSLLFAWAIFYIAIYIALIFAAVKECKQAQV